MRRGVDVGRSVGLLPALLLTAACGGDASGVGTVLAADSAGVRILQSVSPDVELTSNPDVHFTLGGSESPEESFYRVGAWNVGTDGSGHIHVFDLDNHQLHLFDSTGAHRRTVGGRGGGPGEIQMGGGLAVDLEGGAWVVDLGRRAFVRFGPDGEVLPQEPFPEGYFGGVVRLTSGGMVVPTRGSEGSMLRLEQGTDSPALLASLPPEAGQAITLESCGMSFSALPPIFSPTLVWAAGADRVVVSSGSEYVIDIYERGRHVRSLRRDLAPRAATAEMARASLGEGMQVRLEDRTVVCDPAEVVEQQGFAPTLPMFRQLAVAPDGAVWAERYEVGNEPGLVDRFGADGQYLGTLPRGSRIPIGFLPDGRIVWSEKDELEVERLVVGRM